VNGSKPRTKAGATIDADGDNARLCAVTRVEKAPEDLIRFVAGPDGYIVPDLARKLPGRGVWISLNKAVVKSATTAAISKSLKTQAKVPQDLADRVELLLLQRARSALSFANKAGLVTAGFMKVEQAITGQTAIILVQAADGADDGIDRLARKYIGITESSGGTAQIIRELTSSDLGLAIGRTNVIHAALAAGGQTLQFLGECLRLRQYCRETDENIRSAPDPATEWPSTSSAEEFNTGKV
jgi:uncharacterized protein